MKAPKTKPRPHEVIQCHDGEALGYFKAGTTIATFDGTPSSMRAAWAALEGLGERTKSIDIKVPGPWRQAPLLGA